MDLEMTGLDPDRDVIVEIATIVTDDDLAIVAEGPDLVVHATEEQLAGMDPVVVRMHTDSGLLTRIRESELSLADAGAQTLAFLREHIPEARTVPLCGNSIGTDRRFLARYLPEIEDHLHYRSVDVSTIKELAKRWMPELLTGAPSKVGRRRPRQLTPPRTVATTDRANTARKVTSSAGNASAVRSPKRPTWRAIHHTCSVTAT